MNVNVFSPAITLLYVFALLWILMGVDIKSFGRKQRLMISFALLFLCITNELLCQMMERIAYTKGMFLFMHLPMFLLYFYIAKKGVVKTIFMILTAIVFTAPTILVANVVARNISAGWIAGLLSDLFSYTIMLLLAKFVFRSSFCYLIGYGDNRFFMLFSLVPVTFYIYMFATILADVSSLTSHAGYIVRMLPSVIVFLCYFMLPYIYKTLSEKMLVESKQNALQQKLVSSETQIQMLNEANVRMAVYRHDVRHQLNLLDQLLSNEKLEQAQQFVKSAAADLDAIVPKRFCENETVNLLCSSYDTKAQNLGVRLKIRASLPGKLSLSDTELCSVISNGLENALRAASDTTLVDQWVSICCEVKKEQLLLQIQNSYSGQVIMENGLPVSKREGHGYGCLSIQTIVQNNHGLCSFTAEEGVFTLRVMIPLRKVETA